MRLLTFPSNQDVFWVVLGLAVLYGAARALLTDGSEKSTQIFDDSPWQLGILIGWPAVPLAELRATWDGPNHGSR
jgi:hypothetical protein